MASRRDGRWSTCPLCQTVLNTGPLRAHVAGVRCLATCARNGVQFTPEQRVLVLQVKALDEKIATMMRPEVPRAGS